VAEQGCGGMMTSGTGSIRTRSRKISTRFCASRLEVAGIAAKLLLQTDEPPER